MCANRLMQIGKAGACKGSNDPEQPGRPAHWELDAAAHELDVADGYGNRRVIVFDAATGTCGNRPDETKTRPTTRSHRSSPTRCTACG